MDKEACLTLTHDHVTSVLKPKSEHSEILRKTQMENSTPDISQSNTSAQKNIVQNDQQATCMRLMGHKCVLCVDLDPDSEVTPISLHQANTPRSGYKCIYKI